MSQLLSHALSAWKLQATGDLLTGLGRKAKWSAKEPEVGLFKTWAFTR